MLSGHSERRSLHPFVHACLFTCAAYQLKMPPLCALSHDHPLPLLHHPALGTSLQTGLTSTSLTIYYMLPAVVELLQHDFCLDTRQQRYRDALGTEFCVFLPWWKSVFASSIAAHVPAAVTGCRRTAMSCHVCLHNLLYPCSRIHS